LRKHVVHGSSLQPFRLQPQYLNIMKNIKKKGALHFALIVALSGLVSACGGGSSNSGGAPAAPPPPPFPLFGVGIYNGTSTLTSEGENIIGGTADGAISLEVFGGIAGSQQVRIAFREFSGTSAILREGQFSIPSGMFPIRVTTDGGFLITTCRGEFLFEGTFSTTANTVSGTVMTTTPFICDDSRFGQIGPITTNGTFEASLGAAAKRSAETGPLTVIAEDF